MLRLQLDRDRASGDRHVIRIHGIYLALPWPRVSCSLLLGRLLLQLSMVGVLVFMVRCFLLTLSPQLSTVGCGAAHQDCDRGGRRGS